MTRGTQITAKRQELIDGLAKAGGSIKAESGEFLSPEQISEALGMKMESATAFTGFLRNAESSHIIRRTVKGRRTKAIYLVHGKSGESTENGAAARRQRKAKPESRARMERRARQQSRLPLPQIGQNLTVFLLHEDKGGDVTVGLRHDDGSMWNTTVTAFVEGEV